MATENEAMIIMEWGYKAHEKGMNLEKAKIEFHKVFNTPNPNNKGETR